MIWAWVDEHQISIHPTLRNGQGTSVPLPADLFRGILAADLDAREKLMIRFEIKFKNEIIIVRFRAKNAIRLAFGNGLADDAAVFHVEFGVAGFLSPTREVSAVEQIDPVLVREKLLHCKNRQREYDHFEFIHNGTNCSGSIRANDHPGLELHQLGKSHLLAASRRCQTNKVSGCTRVTAVQLRVGHGRQRYPDCHALVVAALLLVTVRQENKALARSAAVIR